MAKRKKHETAGQPPKWETPEALQAMVDDYFSNCEHTYRPLTIAGLAAHLKVSRTTIYNYGYKDEYFNIIKEAKTKIEASWEERAIGNNLGAAGIFVMKNYGYADKQETDVNVNGNFMSVLGKFTEKVTEDTE